MTKKELQETLTLLERQVSEVKRQIENCKDDWRDKLVGDDDYFHYLSASSKYCLYPAIGKDYTMDGIHKFHTKEQADLVAKKCTLLVEMSNYCTAVNDGWVADWSDPYQYKHGIEYLGANKKFIINCNCSYNDFSFGLCVKSEELAKQMLEEFGDRIKEVYNTQL